MAAMSSLRPGQALSRCLVSTTGATSRAHARAPCHHFHTTTPRTKEPPRVPRPRFSDRFLKKNKLESPEAIKEYAKKTFPDMRPEDFEGYTEAQIEAIKAGEEAVSTKDFVVQGRLREDKGRINDYVDDFAKIHPVIDLKPEPEWIRNKNVHWDTDDEIIAKLEQGGPKHVPFNDKEIKTYQKAARSYDDFYRKLRDKELDDMVHQKASNLKGAQKTAFVTAMEKVNAIEGGEIDLTTDELKDIEKFPELAEKLILKDGEKARKQLGEADAEPDSLFEREAMIAVMEEEADRLEALEKPSEEQLALIKEIRYVARKKRMENPEVQETDGILPDIKNMASAPPLGKVPGVEGLYKYQSDPEDEGLDDEGKFEFMKKTTGMSVRDILSIFTKVLVVRNVVNQTRLGKVRSSAIIVIAGNGNGRLGVGTAKSADLSTATMAARMLAIRNMKPIRRYENRTIYGNVREKVSGTIIQLRARPPGYGLRVPSRLFEMCRAAGIHDISGEIPRSRNPMNTVKATFQCLLNQHDPEEIAIGRGKKMVDVRKVYYGGSVY